MGIFDHAVSVVVQGAINTSLTPKCLKSIRRYLPNAEIILSTWNSCNVNGLDYDKLVLSEDPGFFYYSLNENDKVNNVNRQILSTFAGLKVASNEWVLKLRSDFQINGNNFLNLVNKYENSLVDYKVFTNKIIACSYFSRNPKCSQYVFHPSDIAFLGLKKDLLNLYQIPLMNEDEAYYLTINGIKYNRYVPEQYLFIKCLRKNFKTVNFSDQSDLNDTVVEETEKYFVSNFVFYNWNQLNLIAPKKFNDFILNDFMTCITHIEWLKLYGKYVDEQVIIPKKDPERIRLIKTAIKFGLLQKNDKTKKFRLKKLNKLISNIVAMPFYGNKNKNKRNQIRKKIINILEKEKH